METAIGNSGAAMEPMPFPEIGTTPALLLQGSIFAWWDAVPLPGLYLGCVLLACVLVWFTVASRSRRTRRLEETLTEDSPHDPETVADLLLRVSSDALIIADEKWVIQAINPAAERIFGYANEEVVGRSLFFILPSVAPNREHGKEVSRILRQPGEARLITLRGHAKGGAEVALQVCLQASVRSCGTVLAVAARPSESLQSAGATSRPRVEPAKVLASKMSAYMDHLLMTISGYSELLTDESLDAVTCQADLAGIRDACDRGLALSAKLHQFGRTVQGKPKLIDLNSQVTEWVNRRRVRGIDRGELRLHLAPSLPAVNMDPTDLDIVLDCLVDNSFEAIAENGVVAVRTLAQRSNGVRTVTLEVTDTGRGLPAEGVSELVEPFFSTKPNWHALGLGLATVRNLLENSGAQLHAHEDPQAGTTVSIHWT